MMDRYERLTTTDRKEREKERHMTEIIDAAEKLLYEKGFNNVTMDEIADTVEISKGSGNLIFKNKDSLFFAFVDRVHKERFRSCTGGRVYFPDSLSVVLPLPSWDKGLELYGIGYEGRGQFRTIHRSFDRSFPAVSEGCPSASGCFS